MKEHIQNKRKIIAVCDKEIINEEYKEGEVFLSVPSSFFKGIEINEKEVIDIISSKKYESANIIGNNIVELLIKHKVITKYKTISNIKYTHIYVIG